MSMAELRMRDLCARTGLSRQAIHFYVAQGLVEPPRKTGRTMAYYTEAHVERILLIRRLQEEHFLPLEAIRGMLDGAVQDFTAAQRRALAQVKRGLTSVSADGDDAPVHLEELLTRVGLCLEDARELEEIGLLSIRGRGGSAMVSAEDAWLLELWADVRAAGFTRRLGFGPELLLVYERGVARIFEEEKRILAQLIDTVPEDEVAAMVERALPLIHSLLVRAHQRRVRALLGAVGSAA